MSTKWKLDVLIPEACAISSNSNELLNLLVPHFERMWCLRFRIEFVQGVSCMLSRSCLSSFMCCVSQISDAGHFGKRTRTQYK